MSTMLKLGPADHGRELTFEEFVGSDFELGYKYELIHGRVYVSPLPDPPANYLEEWLLDQLKAYSWSRPDVINYVTSKARVYVEGRDDVSYPEPDISAYRNYPRQRSLRLRWREVNPILVVEVLDRDNPEKDTIRNVEVYLSVPSIREYWVLDTRPGLHQPTLLVHRRHGRHWRIISVPAGGTYTTRLLPGFRLVVDPFAQPAGD
jgi:Uma2 family endonuclease